jgi:hypothetical protein
MDLKITNKQAEEIINWTLPGLTMYYRDSELSNDIISKYEVGQIFRSQIFVDVSSFAGRLQKKCRYIIASSKAAPLYQFNSEIEKWKLHVINANSYFKVLDIYKKNGKTQFLLLHIPAKGINFFKESILQLGGNNIEEQIVEKSRLSFDQKMQMNIIPELEEREWNQRTEFPIGLNSSNQFFSLDPSEELTPIAKPLFDAIFKMTNDTDLNIPFVSKAK